jgi:hypothetical protein
MHKFHIISAVAAAFICTSALAAEETRELGPHEHGHGRLNIAIEGKRVSMELEVPGADIAGFEHEASTPEQKAVVEKAKATLADALSIFKLPAAAGCTLADAQVATHAEDEHEHGHEHEDEAGGQEKAGEQHHSEFHAAYAIDCAAPEKLTGIDFGYFDAFAGALELDISLVTPKGQYHYEVTREQPRLQLGEIG